MTKLPQRPDFTKAYQKVAEVHNGSASQERAVVIRAALDAARDYIAAVVDREERAISPQVLLDVNEIFTALKEARIEGEIAMLIEPPGMEMPGKYSVLTEHGKFVGEAGQLATTITLIGKALALARPLVEFDDVPE